MPSDDGASTRRGPSLLSARTHRQTRYDGGLNRGRRWETALHAFSSGNHSGAFILVGVQRPSPSVVGARICTRVILLSVGRHPNLLAMRVSRVAGVDQADAIRIIGRVPTTVAEHISLPSAENAVAALAAAGGQARLELEQNWSKAAAPTP